MTLLQNSALQVAFPGIVHGKNQEEKIANKLKLLNACLASKQHFIFPIHWEKNHWFVVKGDRTVARWDVYDSIANVKATRSVVQVR